MMPEFVVCGWYTNDYRPWWDNLRPTLEAVGAPNDFVEVSKRTGSWEAATLRKASEVQDAMRRHPDKTVIFIDVDCTVRAPLDPLAALLGDVGICISGKANHKGRQQIRIRTGTMVLHPTDACRAFVRRWSLASASAPSRATDQTTIAMVLHQPGLAVSIVGKEWCAIPRDNIKDAKILHESASNALGLHGWMAWLGAVA